MMEEVNRKKQKVNGEPSLAIDPTTGVIREKREGEEKQDGYWVSSRHISEVEFL